MKGRTRTAEEVKLHDRVAALGCICCRIDGIFNPVVSIHHADGRTKPFAHHDVLPLCGPHHQKLVPDVLAIHGDKRRWQARYGNQYDLIQMAMDELGFPYIAPSDRERPTPAKRTAKPKKRAVKVGGPKASAGRKIEQRGIAKPRPKPISAKAPIKRVFTEEQLKAVAENKDQQKALQRQRKVQYELDNKEKIEAQKDRAKAWAKQQRQRIAAKKKGNLDLRV